MKFCLLPRNGGKIKEGLLGIGDRSALSWLSSASRRRDNGDVPPPGKARSHFPADLPRGCCRSSGLLRISYALVTRSSNQRRQILDRVTSRLQPPRAGQRPVGTVSKPKLQARRDDRRVEAKSWGRNRRHRQWRQPLGSLSRRAYRLRHRTAINSCLCCNFRDTGADR